MTSQTLIRAVFITLCLPVWWFPQISSAVPPVAPANFTHKIYSDSAAELFWQRSTNVATRGYEIVKNGESIGVIDALSYFDDTLAPGIDYTYTITAVGANGERSTASVLTLRTPQSADTIANLRNEITVLESEITLLESLLAEGVRSPVPQSGQTFSLLQGDDGYYQAGVAWPDPRFTLNVNDSDDMNGNGFCDETEICNGTVTDELTGLVWLQEANCFGARGWIDAINDANNLADDGSSNCGLSDNSQAGDWRVPNVKEILSIMDYGQTFPTLLLPTGHPFVDVQVGGVNSPPDRYWTSTAITAEGSGVYAVSISVGWVERFVLENFDFFVWPVKGGL